MTKDIPSFDKVNISIMGYSFIFAFIFINIAISYFIVGSVIIHYSLKSNVLLNYLISFALTYLIFYINSYTIGSKGFMKMILKRDHLQDDNLFVKFADTMGSLFICGLIAFILNKTLSIKIAQEIVDSTKLIQYLIMGCIFTFLTTMFINVVIRRNLKYL